MITASPSPEEKGDSFAEPPSPFILDLLDQANQMRESVVQFSIENETAKTIVVEEQKEKFVPFDLDKKFDTSDWELAPGWPQDTFFPYEGVDVPASRIRVVGQVGNKHVHQCFEPYYDKLETSDVSKIASMANRKPSKWKIAYRLYNMEFCTCLSPTFRPEELKHSIHGECGRVRKSKVEGSWENHVANLQFGMPDDNYNGHYPTLPGNDVAHYNPNGKGMDAFRGGQPLLGDYRYDNQDRIIEERQVVRGGKEIRGGKAEWRLASKGLELYDRGYQRDIAKIKAREEEKKRAERMVKLEKALNKGPAIDSFEF